MGVCAHTNAHGSRFVAGVSCIAAAQVAAVEIDAELVAHAIVFKALIYICRMGVGGWRGH